MLLERTISQLDIGDMSPAQALELGQLGYLQWLGAAPAKADYREEATRALAMANAFAGTSPAIAVFCDLLTLSLDAPLQPLPIKLPERHRRGGSRARRTAF